MLLFLNSCKKIENQNPYRVINKVFTIIKQINVYFNHNTHICTRQNL